MSNKAPLTYEELRRLFDQITRQLFGDELVDKLEKGRKEKRWKIELPEEPIESGLPLGRWYVDHGMDPRAAHKIGRANIQPKDLPRKTDAELLEIRNLGKAYLKAVRQFLEENYG